MRITCPWPPQSQSPNSRAHHMAKHREGKRYGAACGAAALVAGARRMTSEALPVRITFCPPGVSRKRDRDNMIASFKAGQDAIAAVIGVDDHLWQTDYAIGEPCKDGAVLVDLCGSTGECTP